MKQECKDCNKSLEHCTCIEDTIELKEAAENHAKIFQFPFDCDPAETFINGAKWQQEQDRNVYLNGYVDGSRAQAKLMYNEEEVIKIIYQFHYDLVNSNFDTKEEWFEQFKKK